MHSRRPGHSRSALGLALVLALLAVAACDCDGGTGSVSAGFRTQTERLDFGKVLEDAEVTRALELEGTGRGEVTVEAKTTGPFRAPRSVTVPGGGVVPLEVTFTATDGESEGTLTLSARGEAFEVGLRGRGVRPQSCLPTAVCRVSRFVLEAERCEESVAEEGAPCTPASLCLESGVCRAGLCVGTPRRCDDLNACTHDACSEDVGCVHLDVSSQCPRPPNPCERSTCDPTAGCGVAPRDDGDLCGPVDCVNVSLCQAGTCRQVPTPDGMLCAPPTPCQGEGRCQGGACRRPDAGVMTPAWSLELGTPPGPVSPQQGGMLELGGNLFFTACGLVSQDGGCALASYTGNGFLRFAAPTAPDATLHAVSPAGALLEQGGVLRSVGASTGAAQWSLELGSLLEDGGVPVLGRGALVVEPDGGVTIALSSRSPDLDGGPPEPVQGAVIASLDPDGGVLASEPLDAGFGCVLARSAAGSDWLRGPQGETWVRLPTDGGSQQWTPVGTFVGDGTLSAAGRGGAVAGGAWRLDEDGGALPLLDGGEAPLGVEALSGDGAGYVFFSACRDPFGPACLDEERSTQLRAFSLQTGAPLWEAKVTPALAPGQVVEAALPGGALSGSVLALTQVALDAGVRLDLQLFAAGERVLLCPLEGEARARAARFEQGFLYVLVERGGRWRLESYDLMGTSILPRGWPSSGGASGQRTER